MNRCMMLLFLAVSFLPATAQTIIGLPIGAGQATFDSTVVDVNGQINAFVPTGSDSPICLVTLGESNGYSAGPSPAICIPRLFEGQKGVRIIVIPYFVPFRTDLTLTVTVYQKSARRYGQPVLYTGQ